MNTYLVNVSCYFSHRTAAAPLELVYAIVAESPEHIEQPLRTLLIQAQKAELFNQACVEKITLVPSQSALLFSFGAEYDALFFDLELKEDIVPEWVERLVDPEKQASHFRAFREALKNRRPFDGEPYSERQFLVFPDADAERVQAEQEFERELANAVSEYEAGLVS